jgi:hypothetical protein
MCSLGFLRVDIRIRVMLGISRFASFFRLNGWGHIQKSKPNANNFLRKFSPLKLHHSAGREKIQLFGAFCLKMSQETTYI